MNEHEKSRPDLFEDDELDEAIANADDTGMVRSQQQIVEAEEDLPPEE